MFALLTWLLRSLLTPHAPPKSWYQRYLCTAHWRAVRGMALCRDGYRCRACGTTRALQVHHLTYKHLGHEQDHLEDLKTLCRRCHRRAHGR